MQNVPGVRRLLIVVTIALVGCTDAASAPRSTDATTTARSPCPTRAR